ncbi:MAG TPA: hypothetical protein PLW09_08305 [Candidatus Kapabacteria bacterium]|nr:hypothetical protein [Candidatus Kapabacteria bacterium]
MANYRIIEPIQSRSALNGLYLLSQRNSSGGGSSESSSSGGEAAKGLGVSFGGKTVPVFRGGSSFTLKPGEFKLNADGLVKTTHGVSLDVNASTVSKFGGAYQIESIPNGLKIIQRGPRPEHFEIVPSYEMSVQQFQGLLNQIKTIPVK